MTCKVVKTMITALDGITLRLQKITVKKVIAKKYSIFKETAPPHVEVLATLSHNLYSSMHITVATGFQSEFYHSNGYLWYVFPSQRGSKMSLKTELAISSEPIDRSLLNYQGIFRYPLGYLCSSSKQIDLVKSIVN
jgi:hypothetical protein